MRIRLLAALLAWPLLTFSAPVAAQDEASDDMDELMQSDPEHKRKQKRAAEEEAAPSGDEDERPPVDEEDLVNERPPADAPTPRAKRVEPAPEPETGPANKLSIGLLLGYGISFEEQNPWALGFGVRAGYNFGNLYLGPRLAFQLGEEFEREQRDVTQNLYKIKASTSLWEIGAELGFDLLLTDSVDLRPFFGLGFALVDTGQSSDARVYIAPGVDLVYNVSESFFLALDLRLQVVFANSTSSGVTGLPIFANVGMRF